MVSRPPFVINESLKGCEYNLTFTGNVVIFERSFPQGEYKNKSDTVNFSVNLSGIILLLMAKKPR